MSHRLTRADLVRMYPRALPDWLDAMMTVGPVLADYYTFTRLDWVHFCGQIDAETDGLSLRSMQEDMRFRSAARILEVYSYRLGVALEREPALKRQYGTKPRLAAALVGNPKELADLVYGGREGTPWRQGSRYLGRGPTQITHLNNYREIGNEIAKQPGGAAFDLVANPELLAINPELGIRSAFADWKIKGLSRYARADDCDTLSDALNTGNIRDNVKPHGLPRRRKGTASAKKIWTEDIDFSDASVPAPVADPAPPEIADESGPVGSPLTPKTMIESKTGNAALGIGTGAVVSIGVEGSTAVTRVVESGHAFSLEAFFIALLQSATFWVSMITLLCSVFIWLDRRYKLHTFGI